MSASFCLDGKHVISASEDSQVYAWKVEETKNQAAAKKKTVAVVAVNSHENLACKDVTVAITWPGSTKFEAPLVDLQPKKNTKKPAAPTTPTQEEGAALPPLPKKKKEAAKESLLRRGSDGVSSAPSDEGVEATESAAAGEGETPSLSHSQSENASSSSSGGGGTTIQATAWGLVIVTATVEGEIKVFQNFGLPLKVARQMLFF